jgi:N-acetylmuramoyl-L-alanine amidase
MRRKAIFFLFLVLLIIVGYWVQKDKIEGERPFGAIEVTANQAGAATSNDVYVLAKLITGEARGEDYLGQVAVGAVVVNRVKNSNFPNSVYGVVFEPGAFDAVVDGQYFRPAASTAVQAARAAINGWDPTGGALYYWNPATATSRWIWSRPIIARIGRHIFAR